MRSISLIHEFRKDKSPAACSTRLAISCQGTVSDDGLPDGTLISTWSQSDGPAGGTATFGDTAALDTSVTFDTLGTYEITLTVSDGELQASSTLSVTVSDGTPTGDDSDGDGQPDSIDPDDDNDGQNDTDDPFALDPLNGFGNSLPFALNWDASHGYLLDSGFTGLMSNGSNYSSLYSSAQVSLAGGLFTVSDIPAGDPYKNKNTQQYGFQFGVDVSSATDPFTAHARISNPFAGVAAPKKYQSMGLYELSLGRIKHLLRVVHGWQSAAKERR